MDSLVKQLRDPLIKGAEFLRQDAANYIEQLEAALAHIYAWYPISVTQPRQTIDDIREFAKAALGEKKDD